MRECRLAEPSFSVGDIIMNLGVEIGKPFWMRNGDYFTNMGAFALHVECRHGDGTSHNLVLQPFESITATRMSDMTATRLMSLEDKKPRHRKYGCVCGFQGGPRNIIRHRTNCPAWEKYCREERDDLRKIAGQW